MPLAQFLGLHAQNAYQTGLDLRRALVAYEAVGLFQRDRGYLAGSGEQLVIAFAGPRAVDDEFGLNEYCDEQSAQLADHAFGRVHSGSHRQVQLQLKVEMLRGLEKLYTGQTVLLTGHSRGGALALLMAHELQQAGFVQVAVVTFGTPKVGDGAFAGSCEFPVYRVECEGDPVPSLPSSGDYAAVGEQVWLSRDGWIRASQGGIDRDAFQRAHHGAEARELEVEPCTPLSLSAEALTRHGIDCYLDCLQTGQLAPSDL